MNINATAVDPVVRLGGVDAFRIRDHGATILVQPATGFVCVSSIHTHELNGSHFWPSPSRGEGTIYEFLADTYPDYCQGKFFGQQRTEEFDLEATRKRLREWVLTERRDARNYWRGTSRGMSRGQARDLWDEIDDCGCADDVNRLSIPDAWEQIVYSEKPCFAYWRERIWGPFIAHVRAMVEQARAHEPSNVNGA